MPLSHHRKGVTPARSKPKSPDPKRTKLRLIAHRRAAMMHAMLGAIGVNPVYGNATYTQRGSSFERQWTKSAKAWLDANQKRYAVA